MDALTNAAIDGLIRNVYSQDIEKYHLFRTRKDSSVIMLNVVLWRTYIRITSMSILQCHWMMKWIFFLWNKMTDYLFSALLKHFFYFHVNKGPIINFHNYIYKVRRSFKKWCKIIQSIPRPFLNYPKVTTISFWSYENFS